MMDSSDGHELYQLREDQSMPNKPEKTNAMRLLEAKGIHYVAHYYSPQIHSAEEVAKAVGLPAGQVFKTLVVVSERGRPLLAIIPGDRELDLKKLAHVAQEKKLRMATHREAESLTGLLVGGISALALLHKGFPVYLDTHANEYAQILVSAGQRGINLQLAVEDLIRVTRACTADISRPPTTLDPRRPHEHPGPDKASSFDVHLGDLEVAAGVEDQSSS